MADLTLKDAALLGILAEFLKSGASSSEVKDVAKKLKSARARALAKELLAKSKLTASSRSSAPSRE